MVFLAYTVLVWAMIYGLGEVLDGNAYWLIGAACGLAGIIGGAYIHRLRVKDLMRERHQAQKP
jgi:hypothetical protein